jgi:putative glutamine amidotransferase
MHILNLYFGGTVEPDIGREHVARDHEVTACSGAPSRIADRFPLVTNSFHEQAVVPDRLGADLCCLATSKDGFVEAFMHRTQPIFGVQWHPERPNRAADFDRWAIESLFASDAVNND